jgi:hypothetical protein
MADVCKQGGNSLNSTKVLIAFVPGVMGSRLHLTAGGDWDPDDQRWTGAMSRWLLAKADSERAQLKFDRGASVSPPPNNISSVVTLTADETRRGLGSIVWTFYGPFLRSLLASYGTNQTVVFGFGYDWRQTNVLSGADLAQRINQAADSECADGVIIISHSMGGLATRSALQQDAKLNGRTMGVIHVFQPAAGAVTLYRRFYTGMVLGFDAATSNECTLFGDDADKFATIVSGLNGPMELLPTTNYTDGGSTSWLNCTYKGSAISVGGALIYDFYRLKRATSTVRCTDKPPALGGPTTTTVVVPDELASRVDTAKAFHDGLPGSFKHQNTFAIVGTQLATDVRFLQDSSNVNQFRNAPQRRAEGDGTVPASSASLLFPGQAFTVADICNNAARQFVVNGVAHAAAFNDSGVRDLVDKLIRRILGILCFGPPSPPSPTGDYNQEDSNEMVASSDGATDSGNDDTDEDGSATDADSAVASNDSGDSASDGWQDDGGFDSAVADGSTSSDDSDSGLA